MTSNPDKEQLLNQKLQEWRQGDCVLEPQSFVYAFDSNFRVTEASKNIEEAEPSPYVAEEVDGLVILTQTCDLVRDVCKRPFIEVAPLIKKDQSDLKLITKGMIPRFAEIPGLRENGLVADLDRTMTLEKPIINNWKKTSGCRTDEEVRRFANALARKRARAAFPDDFVELISKFRKQCISKHGNSTNLGKTLDAIAEIRAQPFPSWDGESSKTIKLWFLLPPKTDPSKVSEYDKEIQGLMKLIPESAKYRIDYSIAEHSQISAAEYIASDLLDLDHLSD